MEVQNMMDMLDGSGMVAIPRSDYDKLLRRSTLLDVILEYSGKDDSWKLSDTVETVHKILYGGDKEDA